MEKMVYLVILVAWGPPPEGTLEITSKGHFPTQAECANKADHWWRDFDTLQRREQSHGVELRGQALCLTIDKYLQLVKQFPDARVSWDDRLQ